MLDKKMEKALNDQLNAEMASGYLYLSMATYFEDKDLPGFGNALRVHAQEELDHAMKFYDLAANPVQKAGKGEYGCG